jgi:RNA polymerase sigma-70 factor (ECF subfamily)
VLPRADSPPSQPDAAPGNLAFLTLPGAAPHSTERAAALVREHLRFVWRLVRRLGLRPSDADDATQRVLFTAVQRIDDIEPGAERGFLYRTAVRIAFKLHSSKERQRELEGLEAATGLPDPTPNPEDLLDQQRARALLDHVLDSMPLDLKAVFVLFEFERLTTSEIALMLDIPRGTAASRLRRAREDFDERVKRLEARMRFSGGKR